jgi:amidase
MSDPVVTEGLGTPHASTGQLWRRSAVDLAALVKERQVSCREVVEAHLTRIAEVNEQLNAIVVVLGEDAMAAAGEADLRLLTEESLGPLHGVPVTVKEHLDVADEPTTAGVPALAAAVASSDSPVVERMRAAGAIPIGRTNMPDFGLRHYTTDSALYGLTRNPWNVERTAGASSGGDAVALAAGMAALGLGSDMGGRCAARPAPAGSSRSDRRLGGSPTPRWSQWRITYSACRRCRRPDRSPGGWPTCASLCRY